MRLRHTLVAAFGALALVVTLPTSASAATGQFGYSYTGLDGTRQYAELIDPPSGRCITLPEVADPGSSNPADSPHNNTDEAATVFTGAHCDGAFFILRAYGNPASDRLKLRSVFFG